MSTFLITGANRGIGLALATRFAERGDNVIATCRDPASAPKLQALAVRLPQRLRVLPLEVTSEASVAALPAAIGEGPVDCLINNAGTIGPERQSTTAMDFDGFLATLNTNTLGPLRVTQAVLPLLQRAATPKIVTLSSWMGSMSHRSSDRIAYRTSKAAVNKVMQGLDTDLRPKGMALLTLHPGWVRTDMGGAEADIDVSESIAGIVRLIDGLTVANSGRFMNYDGVERPW